MIDELDRKIVWVLNANARKSFREIAKEVGTSATAVINTVKKLERPGPSRATCLSSTRSISASA